MQQLFDRIAAGPLPNVPEKTQDELLKANQQARRNALLSTGPVTAEGKRKSSQNARKHGYAGANIVIEDEDVDAYNAHVDSYFLSFNPKTQVENDTVRRAANATWRVDRLTNIESGVLEIELTQNESAVDICFESFETRHKLAYTFMQQTHTEGSTALALCLRYLAAANRDFDRAIRTFYLLKENRLTAEEQLEAAATVAEIADKRAEKPSTPNEPTPGPQIIPFPAAKPAQNGGEKNNEVKKSGKAPAAGHKKRK